MMKSWWGGLVAGVAVLVSSSAVHGVAAGSEDPYGWLEDVTGERALDWVKARNAEAVGELAQGPAFEKLRADLLQIYDSKDRIPLIEKRGAYYYNFWQDAKNPRGLWRRTTLDEYRKVEPKWEVLLDVDALGAKEKVSWVFKGASFLREGGYRRALVRLSRGGSDAATTREFDVEARAFVAGGFAIPEAKGNLAWIDRDTVYVATDFGTGSMTTSGYARVVKRWKRGAPLSEARVVYEGQPTDMRIGAWFDDTPGFPRHFVHRAIAFYQNEYFLLDKNGSLTKIDLPRDAKPTIYREWLLVNPRTAWSVGGQTIAAGSLVATRFDDFMAGKRQFEVLFEPTPRRSLASLSTTRHHLIIDVLEDVNNRLTVLTPGKDGWKQAPLKGAPPNTTSSAWGVDPDESDDYFLSVSGYLTPASLSLGQIGGAPELLKQAPALFDASGLEVTQRFATSKDGTRVPYFQVARRGLELNGKHPTLLYGYGGFEIAQRPRYVPDIGRAWLSPGGVYVVANIRGGGEYGPAWHQAALKQNRHRAYEDFAAVAEDLIARKITRPAQLAAMGGSNGGLLVGNMLTQYPQLFGAIDCRVPLLDMRRYSKLLAGASWMAEYGDPDKAEDWAYIQTFSPYHNLKPGVKYPPALFTTSTRDDRVHPAHARKMAARLKELGADVRSYENIEGGHGGAADNSQRAFMNALAYRFLWKQLQP